MSDTGLPDFSYRISSLERRISRVEDLEPAVVRQQVNDIREDMNDLKSELRAMRRALYGVALSISAGAVIFAFTAFQLWGTP